MTSRHEPRPAVRLQHPEWSRAASLYQLNQRSFTPEGTFAAAQAHLPRLRDLGVDIIWLMPVHPIGEVNRKGSLGSPYAVRDYLRVNPEFGDLEDLRRFVAAAHELGLRVILDWVANHTAWDNPLVDEHPEWYARDWQGRLRPTPWWDWDDIVDLDFSQVALREWMSEAMCFWVREADVDGFRCDVAGHVPIDFWEQARADLEEIKPVFLLAEWETRDLHDRAFDASYAWSWNSTLHKIAHGRAPLDALIVYYAWNAAAWPRDVMRMTFTSNHDKNSWEGTDVEQFGDALPLVTALSVVGEGIPLVYTGQEAGLDHRLAFFDKDEVTWGDHPRAELYRHLLALKKRHPALHNGAWGAPMTRVTHSHPEQVLAFVRRHESGDAVLGVFNLSAEPVSVTLGDGPYVGPWVDAASSEPLELTVGSTVALPAWGYRVLVGG